MVFTIEEIKRFLEAQENIEQAIKNLSDQAIMSCIKPDDFWALNYQKNEATLYKYEAFIGMAKRKEEQIALRRHSEGEKGRKWMACSPKWIDGEERRKNTKYEIGYWVNYGDDTTYGWFTVEQIIQWFENPEIFLHQLGGTKER